MVRGTPHVIDVTGPKALLARCRSGEFEFYFSEKVILELIHTRWCEENRRVPRWHQHVARASCVSFTFEEFEVLFA